MKTFKRYIVAFMTAALAVMMSGIICFAEEYKYTVTVYSGNYGVFTDKDGNETDTLTIEVEEAGSVITVSEDIIKVTDDKYHVRSSDGNAILMRAGQQNYLAAIEVKGDAEYVVTYGVEGERVAYTVNYLDEKGNEVWPSETFYGIVGEEAVVAYRYVTEYLPQAYNLEKTLKADASENVFTFTYHKTKIITNIIETTVDNGVTVIGGIPGGSSQSGENGSGTINGDNGEKLPEEIINIDDEKTPEGGGNTGVTESGSTDTGKENNIKKYVPVAAGALCLLWLLLLLKRLKKDDESDTK